MSPENHNRKTHNGVVILISMEKQKKKTKNLIYLKKFEKALVFSKSRKVWESHYK